MKKTILLVEDSPSDEKLLMMALAEDGLAADTVVIARDGQEALDYLFGGGTYAGRDVMEKPAIVILDLHLPKVDGLDVLRRIRADERTKAQPVVIMTSSDLEQDRVASYDLGANSYVQKPLDFSKLQTAMRILKFYWLNVNEPPQ